MILQIMHLACIYKITIRFNFKRFLLQTYDFCISFSKPYIEDKIKKLRCFLINLPILQKKKTQYLASKPSIMWSNLETTIQRERKNQIPPIQSIYNRLHGKEILFQRNHLCDHYTINNDANHESKHQVIDIKQIKELQNLADPFRKNQSYCTKAIRIINNSVRTKNSFTLTNRQTIKKWVIFSIQMKLSDYLQIIFTIVLLTLIRMHSQADPLKNNLLIRRGQYLYNII